MRSQKYEIKVRIRITVDDDPSVIQLSVTQNQFYLRNYIKNPAHSGGNRRLMIYIYFFGMAGAELLTGILIFSFLATNGKRSSPGGATNKASLV